MARRLVISERSSWRAAAASWCRDSIAFRLSSTSRSAPVASTAWPIWAASVSRLYGAAPGLVASGEASTKRQSSAASQAATSQPKVSRLARRSAAGSSSVTNTPGWPRRTPWARNCPASTVLALPACPATTVARRAGRPPIATWSKPGIPVASFGTDNPRS